MSQDNPEPDPPAVLMAPMTRREAREAAAGIVEVVVQIPVDRMSELREITFSWREEAKLLLESDRPTPQKILHIHAACHTLGLELPVAASETRNSAGAWLLAQQSRLALRRAKKKSDVKSARVSVAKEQSMPRRPLTSFAFAWSAAWAISLLSPQAQAQPLPSPAGTGAPYDLRPGAAPVARAPLPPPAPIVTWALRPGYWALEAARYVWVPPETRPHRVQFAPLVPGAYVWRDGAYVWVPEHYAK